MSSQLIGSQEGDSERTPTLRQYLQKHGKVAQRCYVRTIFLPSKTGSFGLVCDPGFRISIPESSPLFPIFRSLFDDIERTSLCLFVHVTDTERCHWQLESCDQNITEWESMTYGLRSIPGRLAVPVSARERAASRKGRTERNVDKNGHGSAGASLSKATS